MWKSYLKSVRSNLNELMNVLMTSQHQKQTNWLLGVKQMVFKYKSIRSHLALYLNTICLTPNSQFVFLCWGVIKH